MGIKCSQTQNSMVIFQALNSFDEQEQQSYQANYTLKYSFPQKQILENINTKQLCKQEENPYRPQQPQDPGSPMEALSEQSLEACEQTQFYNSCPTNNRINRKQRSEFYVQHKKTQSIKQINFSPPIQNNTFNQKGIIKKSKYSHDSQSPKSTQTIKSVRFLVTEQVRGQKKLIRTKSLSRRQSSKRLNQSTIYSNCDQSFYYKIEL